MYRIMIVEDDEKIAGILRGYIEKYGYEATRAEHLGDVKGDFLSQEPDLVILDINLPQFDGFYWCRQIRTVSNVPIIFLSARVGEMDQVMALENGGDDYITKPFSLDVIMAKIKSALRRAYGEYAGSGNGSGTVTDLAGVYLDRSKNQISWRGKVLSLSQKELLLLDCLFEKHGQVVPREELLEVLWDDMSFVDDNTLTVNVTRVRKKLEDLGVTGAIETVRGRGYRLNVTWRQES